MRATWGRDGSILLVQGAGAPILRLSESGGETVELAKAVAGESRFSPQFLPDGRHFLYWVVGANPEQLAFTSVR